MKVEEFVKSCFCVLPNRCHFIAPRSFQLALDLLSGQSEELLCFLGLFRDGL